MISIDAYVLGYILIYELLIVMDFCKNSIKKAVKKNSFNFLYYVDVI